MDEDRTCSQRRDTAHGGEESEGSLALLYRPRLQTRLRLACDGGRRGRPHLVSLGPGCLLVDPDTCGVVWCGLWREEGGERERERERRKGAVAVLMIVERPRKVGPTAEGAERWKSARPRNGPREAATQLRLCANGLMQMRRLG
jgi:hypothetical protein